MNYQRIYTSIIEKAQSLERNKGKGVLFEKHHIIPKSLGGSNGKSNLVLLTPKEHYICHRLLVEIYKGTTYEHKMYYAMWCMINGLGNQKRYATSSKIYESFRIKIHEIQSQERYDNRKTIEQYSLEGTYIASFDSVKTASKQLNINRGTIENCARGECKTAGGYNWKYKGSDKIIEPVNYKKAGVKKGNIPSTKGKKFLYGTRNIKYKKVIQFDLNLILLKEWNSIYEASTYTNTSRSSIENCARGVSKTAGGFIWKYKEI